MVSENEEYFAKEDEVFFAFISKIQEAIMDMEGPDDIYIDATHVNEKGRRKVLSKLDLDNVENITVVVMDVPLEVAINRNDNRTGRTFVPHSAIRRMALSEDEVQPGGIYNYKVWKVNEYGGVTVVE
jgi:predicted kinase